MSRKSILLGAVLGMTAMMSAPMANAQIASTTSNGLNYADGWAVKAPLDKPRIIITTDPELDDNNSMIRFLLFSTDYDVEGLIYTSSQFHWRGDGKGTLWWVSGREYDRPGLNFKPMTHYRWDEGQQFIDDVVNAYEEAYPNLKVHDSRYPTPEYLRSKVAWGNCDFDGDFSKDTPGSELIKRVLLDDEPGPVFVQAWGGCSTIARALKSIEDIYSQQPGYDELKKKVSQKLVLCLSGDQDNLYTNYIRPYWPDVKQQPTGVGAPSLSFMSAAAAKTDLHKQIYGSEWMNQNILSKGKLGELYRVWGDGKQYAKGDIYDFFGFSERGMEQLRKEGYVVWCPLQPKGTFLSEGDTFCYLNLIDNGLYGYVQNWGGWAGYQQPRRQQQQNFASSDMSSIQASLGTGSQTTSASSQQSRAAEVKTPDFLPPVMYSFAERMLWSVTPKYEDANHEPQISGPTAMTAHAGETLKLKYTVSDPDKGQRVETTWWKHPSCSYEGECNVDTPSSASTTFKVPADAKSGDEIHLVLQATDNGALPLTRYLRLVITVE